MDIETAVGLQRLMVRQIRGRRGYDLRLDESGLALRYRCVGLIAQLTQRLPLPLARRAADAVAVSVGHEAGTRAVGEVDADGDADVDMYCFA